MSTAKRSHKSKSPLVDWQAMLKREIPPCAPSKGVNLHGDDARKCGIWARRWIRRKPVVKVSRKVTWLIASWCDGSRPVRVREFLWIVNYVTQQKAVARQKTRATLQIKINPLGGLTLGRPLRG